MVAICSLVLVGLPLARALAAPLVTEDLTGGLEPQDLANALIGEGITISNVVYTGADVAAGTFDGGGDVVGLESGIILSSGDISNVIGPNQAEDTTTENNTDGDADLDGLTGGFGTFDAAVLEFDFVPSTTTVRFNYVFASEEYNEFVDTEFNDVFAFFVNGQNCALVEGDPVSINTINNGAHSDLYVDNTDGHLDTEMDGLTAVLTCEATVTPGEPNHIKLAIADTSDLILDSAVFLGAETFVSAIGPFNFWTPLSGGAEVPPVDTTGTGVVGMSLNAAETQIRYVVITYNLEQVTAAHIHCGTKGENGPVGVTLFSGGPLTQNGIQVQGSFTGPDEGNECGWSTLVDVLAALRSGTAYVNVHTQVHAPGEVRGQIQVLVIPQGPSGSFADDDAIATHQGNIEAIAAVGITLGCDADDPTLYCPAEPITRAQMASFLVRALQLHPAEANRFGDIAGSGHEASINALVEAGITKGCDPDDPDLYCPTDPVTRAQMASFLVRALGLTAGAGEDLFTDDDGSTHEQNIDALATAGITLGCDTANPDLYCPDEPVTRAQMASFFARFLEWRPMAPGG